MRYRIYSEIYFKAERTEMRRDCPLINLAHTVGFREYGCLLSEVPAFSSICTRALGAHHEVLDATVPP